MVVGKETAGDGRNETRDEQLDRNWAELLQELRVMQTGTQIISGFLLTLPFQQRFAQLAQLEKTFYVILVLLAAVATGLMLVPVGLHRRLFRHHVKEKLVANADRISKAVLACVALLISGSASFVVDVVAGRATALVIGVALLVLMAVLLLLFPLSVARSQPDKA
jgi:hypothetical protein